MKALFKTSQNRGSALLIVLGFLSFMMISGVSFAIYMRIERQASSNYRHTITARHMLNAGLYRAIDEIDADLRDTIACPYKFPTNWINRVHASAVEDDGNNELDAHVLSLESLSFIPGILVNDVRRYAVRDPNKAWTGAKWREISMPVTSLGDENGKAVSADGQAVVGRYAYVCVNVSDMLNVNACKGAMRDSESNRVGIAHLFGTDSGADSKGKQFDNAFTTTDQHYDSLQDFYACMYYRHTDKSNKGVNTPDSTTPFGSPYHSWLGSSDQNAGMGFNSADKEVLITDGIVKPEPKRPGAVNLLVTDPLSNMKTVLGKKNNDPTALTLESTFKTALTSAMNKLPSGAQVDDSIYAGMIADYLDANNVPNLLNSPSVEMVPMISQIVMRNAFAPKIVARTEDIPGPPPKSITVYKLQLVGKADTDNKGPIFSVETVFPFKNFASRTIPSCKLKVTCCYKIVKGAVTLNTLKTEATYNLELESPKTDIPTCTQSGKVPTTDTWCYQSVDPIFDLPAVGANEVPLVNSENPSASLLPGFGINDEFSVVCAMLVQVFQGNDLVDQAPCLVNLTDMTANTAIWKSATAKLYVQSAKIKISEAVARAGGAPYTYDKNSLECPDPRFNYKASNWVSLPNTDNEVDKKRNQCTTELLGQAGRDADIFMFVSDQGVLHSPGELGFIVRPFNYSADCNATFLGKDLAEINSANSTEDKDAMFRTIRLYDHGDPSDSQNRGRDRVFEYFMSQNLDGTVSGARVNPLSDIPVVLQAAIHNTPVDYYWAAQKDQKDHRFNDTEWDSSWSTDLMPAWAKDFRNVQTIINSTWQTNLVHVYGDWDRFHWYSEDTGRKSVFETTVNAKLFEIDRKMLMSYSLDAFSDRQQLFLYILRAEATTPSLGNGAEEGVKSLSGGRAVALVWRDPYPVNYALGSNGKESYTPIPCTTEDEYLKLISPWLQYYQVQFKNKGYSSSQTERRSGLHDYRILFFKQLDN